MLQHRTNPHTCQLQHLIKYSLATPRQLEGASGMYKAPRVQEKPPSPTCFIKAKSLISTPKKRPCIHQFNFPSHLDKMHSMPNNGCGVFGLKCCSKKVQVLF